MCDGLSPAKLGLTICTDAFTIKEVLLRRY